jgi:hypothetical protein
MRNATVLLALLLAPAVHAATVEMRRPHIEYMGDVTPACKAHRKGCTTITTDFYCGCAESGGKWGAVPHVIAQPTIYVRSDEVLRHEFLHLADIRGALRTYASALTMHTFETEDACTAFVNDEAKGFSHVMYVIQRDTTIRRDGIQYADTEPVTRERRSSPVGGRR